MDRENLLEIKKLIDDLIGEDGINCPTDEDLDYDDSAIEIYAKMRDLQESLENYGF